MQYTTVPVEIHWFSMSSVSVIEKVCMGKGGLYIQLFPFCRDDYWRFSSWHFYFWVNAKSCLFVFTVFPITLFGWALRKKALFLSLHKGFCSQFTSVLIAAELHGAFSSCLILILSTVVLLEKFTVKKKQNYSLERNDVRCDPGR